MNTYRKVYIDSPDDESLCGDKSAASSNNNNSNNNNNNKCPISNNNSNNNKNSNNNNWPISQQPMLNLFERGKHPIAARRKNVRI